ncbi:hypothetical protein UT5_04680 [Ferrigenium sp. UT5]
MCNHALPPLSRATSHAWGAQTNGGSTTHTTSGRQKICRNMTGKLESAKLAKCRTRFNPDGLAGTHNGQR